MVESPPNATDVLVLISAIFVLMMTIPGLTLFYGSLVGRRNLIDTMLQSVVLTASIPLLWWFCGYSFCFDGDGDFFGGWKKSFLDFEMNAQYSGVSEPAWCLFQLTFGVITAVIATGAVAERALLWPLMILANAWLLVVYCPICHMVWGGGYLQKLGVIDTAGGLVVETCSGITALVLCAFVGPRRHASEDADPVRAVLHIVGGALLWVGWLAFNGGSAYTSGARTSMTMLNTFLSGSAGSVGWIFMAGVGNFRKVGLMHMESTFHLMGGAVAGLVAATPSSGYVSPLGAVIIGLGAGIICSECDVIMKDRILPKLFIDDVVSVFPVHGVGGIFGTIMTGVLAVEEMGGVKGAVQGNWSQVWIQCIGVVVITVWTVVGTAVLCCIALTLHALRSTEQEEEHGLDARLHMTKGSGGHLKSCRSVGHEGGTTDESSTDEESGTLTTPRAHFKLGLGA